jgi:signal transduction histidine kinase
MLIATIMSFMIMKSFRLNLIKHNIIEYVVIGIIQFLLIYLFFKIKRFKYGFSFLQGKETMNKENTSKIGILVSSIIIAISLVLSTYSRTTSKILIAILILGGILMIYWIKKSITKYYKEKMKERTVEIQQEQIKQQDEKIKNLQTELADVLQINHKYSHRISAMEKAVTKLGTKLQANEEFAEECGDILSSIKKLSKEYKEEVASVIKETKLLKTNIFSIDNLLEYMKQESEKDKIDFKLNLDFDINEILKTKIPQSKLETMLADHIRDAIIAINCSENKERKIKVVLGKEDNNYQIKFYDTGIEFEIETLSKLGLKRTTTHKSTGGSGIGFMTTFETLKQCKASLIIEEYSDLEYTKVVIIKFDNKNEYRIHSYRAEEIKNKIKDNRIIIE